MGAWKVRLLSEVSHGLVWAGIGAAIILLGMKGGGGKNHHDSYRRKISLFHPEGLPGRAQLQGGNADLWIQPKF